jgi:hypothetical protein
LVLQGGSGRRATYLLVTPDGRIGLRKELREVRYRSQRCWSKKKSLAWQRIRVYKKLGFNPSLEWAAQHLDDVPSRLRRMNRRVYARLVARLDKYGPLAQSAD